MEKTFLIKLSDGIEIETCSRKNAVEIIHRVLNRLMVRHGFLMWCTAKYEHELINRKHHARLFTDGILTDIAYNIESA